MLYKLIVEKSEYALSSKVMEHLAEGFELWGSPFSVVDKPSLNHPATVLYGQAVIKREE